MVDSANRGQSAHLSEDDRKIIALALAYLANFLPNWEHRIWLSASTLNVDRSLFDELKALPQTSLKDEDALRSALLTLTLRGLQ